MCFFFFPLRHALPLPFSLSEILLQQFLLPSIWVKREGEEEEDREEGALVTLDLDGKKSGTLKVAATPALCNLFFLLYFAFALK